MKTLIIFFYFSFSSFIFAYGPYKPSSLNYILKEKKDPNYYVHFKNDPVNLRNGNLYLGYEDIYIPGRLPLQVFRAYNSRMNLIGPFGKGWTYNFGMYIRETRYETIQIVEADGFINEFSRDGNPSTTKKRFAELIAKEREEEDQSYQALRRKDYYDEFLNRLMNDPDFYVTMKKRYKNIQNFPKKGTYYSIARGKKKVVKHDNGYTLTSNDDLLYEFDLGGKLIKIKDFFTNTLEFVYKDNRLIGIKDNARRTIHFHYKKDSPVIERIEDPIERSFYFIYDDELKLTDVTDFQGNNTRYEYDQYKNLIKIIYPNKKEVRFEYESGRIIKQKGPGDRSVQFSYLVDPKNVNHHSTKFTDELGNSTKYQYFDDERKMIVTDPLGNQKTTTLAGCCQLPTEIKDELGRVTYYTYDAQGNIVSSILPDKRTTTYGYNEQNKVKFIKDTAGEFHYRYNKYGKLVETKDPLGGTYQYIYDRRGDLRIIVNPRGYEKKMSYDDYGTIEQIIDAHGKITRFAHDTIGRLISMADTKGNTYTFDYDLNDNVTGITDPIGTTLHARYDSMGSIILIYTDDKHFIKYAYNDLGKVKEILDPYKNVSRFIYSKKGDLIQFKNTLGHVTAYTYDKLGRLLEITDPLGKKYIYTYDSVGNLITFTNPRGFSFRYSYNNVDEMISMTDPLKATRNFTYDIQGNLTAIIRGKIELVRYEYDSLRRLTKVGYPSNDNMTYSYYPDGTIRNVKNNHRYEILYEYDREKNPLKISNQKGEVIYLTYDNNYNITSYLNQRKNEYRFLFDKLDRLIRITNGAKNSLEFRYDSWGNIIAVEDQLGKEYAVDYDVLMRLTKRTDPQKNSEKYGYDRIGNRNSFTDENNNKKTFIFDSRNQTKSVNINGKKLRTFFYDEMGNSIQAKNDSADITQTFDALNRLILVDEKKHSRNLKYTYDAFGRIAKIELPHDINIQYTRDLGGNLVSIAMGESLAEKIEYLASSKPSTIKYGGIVSQSLLYGDDARVTKSIVGKEKKSKELVFEYRRDGMGNLTAALTPLGIFRYFYDTQNQLIKVENLTKQVQSIYAYDSRGNRESEKIQKISISYKYNDLNQLVQKGGTAFRYDKKGNCVEKVTSHGLYQYRYSADNFLSEILLDGKSIARYSYDPFGRRYQKNIHQGETKTFLYDGINLIYEEGEQSKTAYAHGENISDPLMFKSNNESGYFIKDDLGTVMGIIEPDGITKILQHFDPFGKKIKTKQRFPYPFGYNGAIYDEESELYYLNNRYYDPSTGRFISKDPIGLQGGFNEYIYAHNNPLSFTDPLGLFAIKRPEIPFKGEKYSVGFLTHELLPESFPHLPEFPTPGIKNGYGVFLGKKPEGNPIFINYDYPIFQGNGRGGGGSRINQVKNLGVIGDIITYSYLSGVSLEANPTYDSLKYFKNALFDRSIIQKMKVSHIIRYAFRSPFVYTGKVGKWLWQKTDSPFYHLFPNRDDPYFTTPRIGNLDELDLPHSRNPIFGKAYSGLNFSLAMALDPKDAQKLLYRESFGEALGTGNGLGNGLKVSNGERADYTSVATEVGEENTYGGTEVPSQSSETVQDPYVSSGCL